MTAKRAPSPTTLKIRAFGKVQHLKDKIADGNARADAVHNKWELKRNGLLGDLKIAENDYNQLIDLPAPAAASSDET